MKKKSIEIPFRQWLHIVRFEYDYTGRDREYLVDSCAHMIGLAFQYAVECRYEFVPFVKQFVSSDVFRYFDRTLSVYSHSPYHILAAFDSEMLGKGVRPAHVEQEETDRMELAYWLGYLVTQWHMTEEIDGETWIKQYDVEWIIEQYKNGEIANWSIHKAIQCIRAKFDFKVLS